MFTFRNTKENTSKGFTLVISILIASLVLSVGVSILNISLKEKQLSASGRDSQIAFHNADSGIECALYWDLVDGTPFGTPTSNQSELNSYTFDCNNQTITQSLSSGTFPESSTDIRREFTIDFAAGACAVVTIVKDGTSTTIQSKGRNNCDAEFTRRVERAIQTTY